MALAPEKGGDPPEVGGLQEGPGMTPAVYCGIDVQ